MSADRREATVEFRDLEWPDLPEVGALDEQIFGRDAWSAQSWWSELAGRPRRRYTVVTAGDRIVGYGGVDCAGATADGLELGYDPSTRTIGANSARWASARAHARSSRAAARST